MSEDLEFILKGEMVKKALDHLETELVKIKAGRSQPQMLEGLTVDCHGKPTVLNQVSNVSIMDART